MKPTLALDLDGTLISCAPRHCALMRQLCRADGLAPDFIARFWAAKREGASNQAALHALAHPAAQARAQAWARDIEHWPWLGFDRLLPGVAAVLSGRRHRVAVLTARRERFFLQQQLDRLGLSALIDELIVVPPTDAARAKARHLQALRPLAFVGDTESDADAALAVGTPFLALSCGMRSAPFWRLHGQPFFPDLGSALTALPTH
jgi:phosphoglycolate phosphatase-like HAD superfamily hydrolase